VKNRNVTISDIAKELGVTPSTVSRALSNSPRVNEKTRKKIQSAAQKMGYHQNVMAASLRKGTSGSIGMILPRINRHFFSNVVSGVERIVNPAGYNLLIYQTEESYAKEVEGINTFVRNRVAGIIISLATETQEFKHLESLANMGIPLVQFDRVNDAIAGPKIVNDNFNGGYLAVKHLIKAGYKRIAHLTGALHMNVYAERYNGYKQALKDHGLAFDPTMVFDNAITRDSGEAAVAGVLGTGADAIFCAGDYAALGVLQELKRLKIDVPGKMGLVGLANEPFSEIISPSLSTVELNAFEIGNRAASALIQLLEKKEFTMNHTEIVPVRLIVRESSVKSPMVVVTNSSK
jgi:LacI family transcriptional regulator